MQQRRAARWLGGFLLNLAISCSWAAAQPARVVVNEINYDPQDNTQRLEFVELYNAGASAVDLAGWVLDGGVYFLFPDGTVLGANQYLVVAEDPQALQAEFGVTGYGPFEGRLANEGEEIVLKDAGDQTVDVVDYRLGFPWPTQTEGHSMELIHPDLDNDLGGSWRASGFASTPSEPIGPTVLVAASTDWSFRKGLSEPAPNWMNVEYTPDTTWSAPAPLPAGYDLNGEYLLNTPLADMSGNYTSLYLRRSFTIERVEDLPPALMMRLWVDDGCIVYLNGQEVGRYHVSAGAKSHLDLTDTDHHEANWEEISLNHVLGALRVGENVLAIHALNQSTSSSDFVVNCELLVPGMDPWDGALTPGRRNSVYAVAAPPQVRQVRHTPQEPTSGEPIVITAKMTDPQGVAEARLLYQVVLPGHYIPAYLPVTSAALIADPLQERPVNPEFEDPARWTTVAMVDDGTGADEVPYDDRFTAVIPAQPHRSLVRYRIVATDAGPPQASVTVPYPDDDALNFACYVYDGVPDYQTQTGRFVHTYSSDVLTSLPVYHLVTRAQDLTQCYAYSGADQQNVGNGHLARKAYNWEGALVYEGQVYDHMRYRLRGANGRYHLHGKRSMKFRFNRGHDFAARDRFGNEYPRPWRRLNVSKLFDNRAPSGSPDQNYGLTEMVNSILFNLAGVPTWQAHWFHFRVVDGEQEAPDEYHGDFWGLFLAIEEYDSRFLDARDMPSGNLYKLSSGVGDPLRQRRYQGRDSVADGSDKRNLEWELRPGRTEVQLRDLVNYDEFYRYFAVAQAIRHYDSWNFSDKNIAWYFELQPAGSPYGRVWYLPWDVDLTWGPNWNQGEFEAWWALGGGDGLAQTEDRNGQEAMRLEFRNYVREFRDLIWNEYTVNPILDELAAQIADFVPADMGRWQNAPWDVGRHEYQLSLAEKVEDMKTFAWRGGKTWSSGNVSGYIGPGGQTAVLDMIAGFEDDDTSIPARPAIMYFGPPGFPINDLTFMCTPFDDPQGPQTFAALKWRIAEVLEPGHPGYRSDRRRHEADAVWESDAIGVYENTFTIPGENLKPGHIYRVRVRMLDTSGRWSHWSAPVEFTAGWPPEHPWADHVRITEIMYHPAESPTGHPDAEYVELTNIGATPLDITGAALTDGVTFRFPDISLAPGQSVVAVADIAAFRSIYGPQVQVAGAYQGRLSNGGERLRLSDSNLNLVLLEVDYRDDWYPETDGLGFSLEAASPQETPLDQWSDKAAWRISTDLGGSPGNLGD